MEQLQSTKGDKVATQNTELALSVYLLFYFFTFSDNNKLHPAIVDSDKNNVQFLSGFHYRLTARVSPSNTKV